MLWKQVWFQQTKNGLELKSGKEGRQDAGLDDDYILKRGSLRHDDWLVVISMQEEKEKIFATLYNWENKPLIEKPEEIPSGKVNNKPL